MSASSGTDKIEKKILLGAPVERVWRALADSTEFGDWFGFKFDSPFSPGARMHGVVVGTKADPEVARAQKAHEGKKVEILIENMEPGRLFSFRWHPHATEPDHDYSGEPMTLVAFALEEVTGGVMLTLTESGFDHVPIARRASAFSGNEGGWMMMMKVIEAYIAAAP